MVGRHEWLDAYDLPLDFQEDFTRNDKTAEWASGHPKEWGHENDSLTIPRIYKDGEQKSYSSFSCTISDDAKLLAVSSCDKIWIFDVGSKELRQELDGTGTLRFRPSSVVNETEDDAPSSIPSAYLLLSSVPTEQEHGVIVPKQLTMWELDKHGRLLDQEEPIDTSDIAAKAIASITAELESKHEWSKDFIRASTLQEDFDKALNRVAADHRRRHNTIINDGLLTSYGPSPFSSDGKRLLFNYSNHTTQDGIRVAEKLHEVVVWDVDSNTELFRLRGHSDLIMFTGFSPDDQHIASVSWDGTMRMYRATDGSLEWVTENTGGQCWAGAFSPDSKCIAWTCERGLDLQIHNVSDGKMVAKFPQRFSNWCRSVEWHPDGKQLAFCFDMQAIIWRPFDDGNNGIITQRFKLKQETDWRGWVEIASVSWKDGGNRLVLSITDGSYLIWNSQTNAKEIFKKPKGVEVGWTSNGLFYIPDADNDAYVTVDGDMKVRYWRTSVPAGPSWWEKEREEPSKKGYPETGKYVNVVKLVKSKDKDAKEERDVWAEKGAELWTAQ